MKFKEYLTERKTVEPKMKPVSREELRDLATGFRDTLKMFVDTGHMIYRGTRESHYEFGYYPKRDDERMSQNTGNLYTVVINHSPLWKGYPKRNIICSTNYGGASGYGYTYVIVPKYGSPIGICKARDLWDSFMSFEDEFRLAPSGLTREFYMQPYLGSANFDKADKKFLQSGEVSNVSTYKIFSRLCSMYDKYRDDDNFISVIKESGMIAWIKANRPPMQKYMESYLDPNKNDFIKTKVSKGWDKEEYFPTTGKECWLDCECLCISTKLWDMVIKNEILELS